MAVEFELKFRATVQQQMAIQKAVKGCQQSYCMRTTYYDTPDGALAKRKYTLRRRLENSVSVCTLKTPAGTDGRQETEVECDSIEAAIPALCKLSGVQELEKLVGSDLIEVCGAAFTRIAIAVELENATVEIALDSGVLTGGDREESLCEVEVELKSGDKEAAVAYAMRLAQDYSLVPEKHSKFRRALALRKGE